MYELCSSTRYRSCLKTRSEKQPKVQFHSNPDLCHYFLMFLQRPLQLWFFYASGERHLLLLALGFPAACSQEPLVTQPRPQPLTSERDHYLPKWLNLPTAYSEAVCSWERKRGWAEFPATKASSWIPLPGSRNSQGRVSVATLKGQISSSATDNIWAHRETDTATRHMICSCLFLFKTRPRITAHWTVTLGVCWTTAL